MSDIDKTIEQLEGEAFDALYKLSIKITEADSQAVDAISRIGAVARYWLVEQMQNGNLGATKAVLNEALVATRDLNSPSEEWHTAEQIEEKIKNLEKLKKEADRWPVRLHYIEEVRAEQIQYFNQMGLGENLEIKGEAPKKGRKRNFSFQSRTGYTYFLLDAVLDFRRWYLMDPQFNESRASDLRYPEVTRRVYMLDKTWKKMAIQLPDITQDHKIRKMWEDALFDRVVDLSGGDLMKGRHPEFITRRAEQLEKNGSKSSPLSEAIKEALEHGLEALV